MKRGSGRSAYRVITTLIAMLMVAGLTILTWGRSLRLDQLVEHLVAIIHLLHDLQVQRTSLRQLERELSRKA